MTEYSRDTLLAFAMFYLKRIKDENEMVFNRIRDLSESANVPFPEEDPLFVAISAEIMPKIAEIVVDAVISGTSQADAFDGAIDEIVDSAAWAKVLEGEEVDESEIVAERQAKKSSLKMLLKTLAQGDNAVNSIFFDLSAIEKVAEKHGVSLSDVVNYTNLYIEYVQLITTEEKMREELQRLLALYDNLESADPDTVESLVEKAVEVFEATNGREAEDYEIEKIRDYIVNVQLADPEFRRTNPVRKMITEVANSEQIERYFGPSEQKKDPPK